MSSSDHTFKIIVVGDSGVGKTNLVRRFMSDNFEGDTLPTVGFEFVTRQIPMTDGKIVKLQIWDTAGQERYKAMTRTYFHGALGALLIYDSTTRSSFDNLVKWLAELRDHANRRVVLMVVGNKKDLCDADENARTVATEEMNKFQTENGIPLTEASARTGEGVHEAFMNVASRVYLQHQGEKKAKEKDAKEREAKERSKSSEERDAAASSVASSAAASNPSTSSSTSASSSHPAPNQSNPNARAANDEDDDDREIEGTIDLTKVNAAEKKKGGCC